MKYQILVLILATASTAGCSLLEGYRERQTAIARFEAGRQLFAEKCRTVAGERIYRTVEGVEGILVLKLRPMSGAPEWADPMWPGAAFAHESGGSAESQIFAFLGYEHSGSPTRAPVTPQDRGFITPEFRSDEPSNLPGYRWVEVVDEKDGKRYRYTSRGDEPWQYDKSYLQGYIKYVFDRQMAPDPAPRYGVTYEDHVIPEERAVGIASGTVRVLDLQTNEVLGEMTRFAWAPGGPTRASPSPWLAARKCPPTTARASTLTRQFVDQVLKPHKE